MFDKLLGKKQKGIQIFNIPQKKYCQDQKKLAKMDKKDLSDVISDMEKYIANLTEKLQLGKKQFERSQQRCEQVIQKSNVLNGQMAKISNEHEQLQVKFTNLQSSLEMMIQERQNCLRSEIKYIEQHAFSKEKIKDLNKIFEIYHSQITISQKISHQNKQVKQKLLELEEQYHQLSEKYNQIKNKPSFNNNLEKTQLTNEDSIEKEKDLLTQNNFCTQCQKLQSVIEGKEQIITSLNKQISTQREKLHQNSDKLEELNSDLEHILKKIQTKDQQLTKARQENIELNTIVTNFKRNENKNKQTQDRYKEELINLKNSVNSFEQQVLILRQKLLPSEELCKKMAQQSEKLKNQIEKKEMEAENINQKLYLYEQEIVNLSKLTTEIKQKEMELVNARNQIVRQKNKNEELKKSIQALQEEYQIKLKKVEVTANQERIKAEALKRSLTNLQTKEEENRKNLDSMYENKIQQDGKIVQMEKKLKQYKSSIQYLKKEKIELQKTFESKIKNMEEMVVQNQQEDEVKPGLFASKELSCPSPSPRIQSTAEEYEKETIILQKRIAELEQQVDMLRQQSMVAKLEKSQLEALNTELNANLKSLTLKRQEALRQIKKMSSNKVIQHADKLNERKNSSEQAKPRQKKIAEKAYKGFDILAKLLTVLYKQFLNIHISDIDRKQIKQIESSINSIVRKSLDMKDIFQDYI